MLTRDNSNLWSILHTWTEKAYKPRTCCCLHCLSRPTKACMSFSFTTCFFVAFPSGVQCVYGFALKHFRRPVLSPAAICRLLYYCCIHVCLLHYYNVSLTVCFLQHFTSNMLSLNSCDKVAKLAQSLTSWWVTRISYLQNRPVFGARYQTWWAFSTEVWHRLPVFSIYWCG